jgi:hypothetical protein
MSVPTSGAFRPCGPPGRIERACGPQGRNGTAAGAEPGPGRNQGRRSGTRAGAEPGMRPGAGVGWLPVAGAAEGNATEVIAPCGEWKGGGGLAGPFDRTNLILILGADVRYESLIGGTPGTAKPKIWP